MNGSTIIVLLLAAAVFATGQENNIESNSPDTTAPSVILTKDNPFILRRVMMLWFTRAEESQDNTEIQSINNADSSDRRLRRQTKDVPSSFSQDVPSSFSQDAPSSFSQDVPSFSQDVPSSFSQDDNSFTTTTEDFQPKIPGGFAFPQDAEIETQTQNYQRPYSPYDTPTSSIPAVVGCTKNHDPLCATNGKTYNNLCELTYDQRTTPDLRIARRGEC